MTRRRLLTRDRVREVPLSIMATLCLRCIHGNNCRSPDIADSAGGGVTCLSYRPVRERAMKPEHIAALPDREPCADCACRKGTIPNGTPHSMADFEAAVQRGEPFLCHGDGGNRVCAGWLRAAKARLR